MVQRAKLNQGCPDTIGGYGRLTVVTYTTSLYPLAGMATRSIIKGQGKVGRETKQLLIAQTCSPMLGHQSWHPYNCDRQWGKVGHRFTLSSENTWGHRKVTMTMCDKRVKRCKTPQLCWVPSHIVIAEELFSFEIRFTCRTYSWL